MIKERIVLAVVFFMLAFVGACAQSDRGAETVPVSKAVSGIVVPVR